MIASYKIKKIIIFSLFLLLFLFMACDVDDCWVCFNGKCYECNGKGYNETEMCKVCKGSGICFNCKGTGKIK